MKILYSLRFLVSFFLVVCSTSYGFTLNNNMEASFDSRTVSVNVASASCDHIGLTHDDLLHLAQKAIDHFWNTVPTSSLRLIQGGVIQVDQQLFKNQSLCLPSSYNTSVNSCVPNPAFFHQTGILLVCNSNLFDFDQNSPTLAATLPLVDKQKISNAIILLNDTPSNIFANPLKGLNENELISTLAHEIGHAIGIGHSQVKDSLMYFAIIPKRNHLGWDDINAVTYLYPKKDSLFGLGFCGSLTASELDQGMGHSQRPDFLSQNKKIFLSYTLGIFISFLISNFLRQAFFHSSKIKG